MRPAMKMMMLAATKEGGRRAGERHETGYPHSGYKSETEYETTRNEYNGSDMNYGGVEGRFRSDGEFEYRGNRRLAPSGNYDVADRYAIEPSMAKRRYRRDDSGRFTTRNAYGGGYGNYEAESHYPMEPYIPPVYDNANIKEDYRPMNPIGFAVEPSMHDKEYRQTVEYPQMNEFEHRTAPVMMGHASSTENMKLTREMADEWMAGLQNEDGSKGPHWSMDQIKTLMAQKNLSGEPLEFYVAINAMYSDYSKALKKHGVGDKIDLYVDLAKAFIDDKDAQPDKLARYFQYVVKH